MRFNKNKDYSVYIYNEDARLIWYSRTPSHFSNKPEVIDAAKMQAEVLGQKLGHVSVCDDAESTIVRYTPSGKIWG